MPCTVSLQNTASLPKWSATTDRLSSLWSTVNSCGRTVFREYWGPHTIHHLMVWQKGSSRLSSMLWSPLQLILPALRNSGLLDFSYRTEAHPMSLQGYHLPSSSWDANFPIIFP